jgi:hypothetical protein
MGIGEDMKASVDSVRDELGTDCTLNGSTALGKCGIEELNPTTVRENALVMSEDEYGLPWMMIEVPFGFGVKDGDTIMVDLTSTYWLVRRAITTQCAGVAIAQRCLCIGRLVE